HVGQHVAHPRDARDRHHVLLAQRAAVELDQEGSAPTGRGRGSRTRHGPTGGTGATARTGAQRLCHPRRPPPTSHPVPTGGDLTVVPGERGCSTPVADR